VAQTDRTGHHAFLVASGILLSRVVGFVRQRVFLHYFGLSEEADAFSAAFRIPNLLQNLFGEGVLSASFIPVYARLLAKNEDEEAGRVAGAVAALLSLTVAVIVLIGVSTTPYLIDLIAAGFQGATRDLTIQIVQVLFPGAGLLVISAWCLGILNSHRKFFLSYAAPVLWNVAMIATLFLFRGQSRSSLAVTLAWGSVVGSALQIAIQLPVVLSLVRRLRFGLAISPNTREVVRNFAPVFVSRGVVQISAYVDAWLASWLGRSAMSGLASAQLLYTLPVSLFGMAISAAELPAMSGTLGNTEQVASALRGRLNAGLRRIAFFIVPSAMAFLALGDVIAGGLFISGRFGRTEAVYVWGILAGSALGLLASTLGRLYSSAYYALRDTRTPLRFAIVRVLLTTGLGYLSAIPLPVWLGLQPKWGAAGLTASAGLAGWVEFTLLRRGMNRRIGATGVPARLVARLWAAALLSAAAGWGVKLAVGVQHAIFSAVVILGVYGVVYFAISYLFGVDESAGMLGRILRARTP
jgi:putative peptidoglycan lipid II flippase